jgi:alkyl hydroperoxide reductase subunit AhpC
MNTAEPDLGALVAQAVAALGLPGAASTAPSFAGSPAPHVPPTHADVPLFAPTTRVPVGAAGPLDVAAVRRDFPILATRVHGRPLVWLDNAATTQKPRAVIERLRHFYETENSNIHRAAHTLAARATDAYEAARDSVRRFLGAASRDEIVSDHERWLGDIEETQGAAVRYPRIGDDDLAVSKLYNMLPADEAGTAAGRTAVTNQTVRSVFVVGPDKRIKLVLTYPMTVGRNFDELLRVLDSLQLSAKHRVATPANWKQGEDVIIQTPVSNDDAKALFPGGWTAPKPYLRIAKQPG